ncbi:hypothetical protein E2562_027453 [Oryza meyeriana var. granulata]|uniref:Uncharacterized protein n=1 Tax=Oryza meyeriana var. granulata TaxID=110450 RepID=A0A6G1CJC8_9ORYZ|nr:hypothetical protein E2562_027453 [Oryza meyeriana var. granulata]
MSTVRQRQGRQGRHSSRVRPAFASVTAQRGQRGGRQGAPNGGLCPLFIGAASAQTVGRWWGLTWSKQIPLRPDG